MIIEANSQYPAILKWALSLKISEFVSDKFIDLLEEYSLFIIPRKRVRVIINNL